MFKFSEDKVKDIFNIECPQVGQLSSTTLKKKTHVLVIFGVLDDNLAVICSAPRINRRWQKFASENNLNVRDMIQGLGFKVFIFPGAEELRFSISQGNPLLYFTYTVRI
ncbi:hypothetical protein CR513_03547, partial [Mucuna pruriens]